MSDIKELSKLKCSIKGCNKNGELVTDAKVYCGENCKEKSRNRIKKDWFFNMKGE